MIFLPTKQYQTIHLSLYFIDKIEVDAFLYRFLLSRILTSQTDKYVTKQLLAKKLYSLYGTFVTSHLFVIGSYHIMRFNVVFPNPNVLDDQAIITEIIDIIKSMFFDRQIFQENIFNEAKRYTINQILTRKDRKFEYGKEQLFNYTFSNSAYSVPITGTYEDAFNVSLVELYNYYKNYFLKNIIKIYVSGDLNESLINEFNVLSDYENNNKLNVYETQITPKRMTNHKEILQIGQAYIYLSYYIPINRSHEKYMSVQLATILLGGYPESKLFKTIREKHALAYDVEAHYEHDKNYIFVYAGVNLETQDAAYNLLIDTVNNFIFDGTTIDQLNEAKDYLKNEIYSSMDFQDSLIPRRFVLDLFGLDESIDNLVDQINKVSIDDIKYVLSLMQLTTTYILSGGSSYEE
ncbi:M16 family metallopeptidase [Acholeplasma granularum]|uniref:M16 family metallopeptidase n=1 Tax=Acholeplasma granularum TaxID=264635 RepID=UPI00046F5177|nr:insulinase family protein [Acholeplasma granularum]